MTPAPTELRRVLDWLDERSGGPEAGCSQEFADAALMIREMAVDFDEYADHGLDGRGVLCRKEIAASQRCTCGLDAAREKWRLT